MGTLSGEVFILNRSDGSVSWSFHSGPPLVNSSSKAIVPSLDGYIYLYTEDGLQRYPMTISEIVAFSPFSLGDGINFLGSKASSLFTLDPILQKATKTGKTDVSNNDVLIPNTKMFLGRADQTIHAVDELSGLELWNITVGSFVSSSNEIPLDFAFQKFREYALLASSDGTLKLTNLETNEKVWETKLSSPAIHYGGYPYFHDSNMFIKGLYMDEQISLSSTSSKVIVASHNGTPYAIEKLPNLDIPTSVSDGTDIENAYKSSEVTLVCGKQCDWRFLGDRQCPSGVFNVTVHPFNISNSYHNGNIVKPDRQDYRRIDEEFTFLHFMKETLNKIPYSVLILISAVALVIVIGAHKLSEDILNALFGKSDQTTKSNTSENIVDQQGVLRIGKLEIYTTKVLGLGSSGTVVYEGYLEGRKTAVKRMLKEFYLMAEKETQLLIESDEHPNVIRYYATEEDKDFVYLALSLAENSLDTFVDSPEYLNWTLEKKLELMYQMATGLEHLHRLHIVHRDIKPQNILIDKNGVLKISDMGLAKKLSQDKNSFSTISKGTIGWRAPEAIIQGDLESDSSKGSSSGDRSSSGSSKNGERIKATRKVDIFSMGCLFYYILSGSHPFGERLYREYNIINNFYNLDGINEDAKYLISRMIEFNPENRISIQEVLSSPLFWTAEKKLQFLKDASDFLEFEKPTSNIVINLENSAYNEKVIPGNDWIQFMPEELLKDLHKFRKYNKQKLRDLLRVIRNKAHHYRDLDESMQAKLGTLPEGFLQYFITLFPKLFIFTYNYMKDYHPCSFSAGYFPDNIIKKVMEKDDDVFLECESCSFDAMVEPPPGFSSEAFVYSE